MSQKTLERLECLRKSNSNRQWVNHDLYRLMYKEDLYIRRLRTDQVETGKYDPWNRRGNARWFLS